MKSNVSWWVNVVDQDPSQNSNSNPPGLKDLEGSITSEQDESLDVDLGSK